MYLFPLLFPLDSSSTLSIDSENNQLSLVGESRKPSKKALCINVELSIECRPAALQARTVVRSSNCCAVVAPAIGPIVCS
ncbi:hypothetical protein BJX76DRAFT_100886 [Aspergillus varians]